MGATRSGNRPGCDRRIPGPDRVAFREEAAWVVKPLVPSLSDQMVNARDFRPGQGGCHFDRNAPEHRHEIVQTNYYTHYPRGSNYG
jgi:hypothetical protein